jgi:putative sugar O-methyltransferase
MRVELGSTYWHLKSLFKPGTSTVGNLPPEAVRELVPNNPRLLELKERYSRNAQLAHSFWNSWEKHVNLTRFRGEDDYVSQAYFRQNNRRYELTYAYIEATDSLGLLDKLSEDDLFGVKLWEFVPGRRVSRDLLDSIMEIAFLKQAMGFGFEDRLRVLDIGAGYGRFAYRFNTVSPASKITCIDAIATSTFLSEFYLKFRQCPGTDVVPFDELSSLQGRTFDVAANIHSWSECTKQFIGWWLDRLCELKVPYLFIVPHTPELETVETNGVHLTYDDELEKRNFKLVLRRKKFNASKLVQSAGIFPTEYRLYKRTP